MRSVWSGLLARKIEDSVADIKSQVLDRGPATDLSLYNFNIGFLQGLQEALRLAEEVDNEQLGYSNASSRSAT